MSHESKDLGVKDLSAGAGDGNETPMETGRVVFQPLFRPGQDELPEPVVVESHACRCKPVDTRLKLKVKAMENRLEAHKRCLEAAVQDVELALKWVKDMVDILERS